MEIITTPIDDLWILKPKIFYDDRGYFYESYNQHVLTELGIPDIFVQDNQSCSKKGVLRGMHFQSPPHAQAKLVRVIQGSVMDVAVDIRRDSRTYGQHFSVVLSADNHWQFYLPVGFAHGFMALEDDTVFCYKCSDFYHKDSEGVLRYDDLALAIEWPMPPVLVNEKDLRTENFTDFKSPF